MSAVTVKRGMPAAWWGMAMLIAAEGTLIAVMVATYFYLRFKNVAWPPAAIPEPHVLLPLVMLAVFAAANVPMYVAYRTGRRVWVLLALVGQIAYLVVLLRSFAGDLDAFTPKDTAYGSIYYTLLGADHAHVLVGVLFSLWLLLQMRRTALLVVSFYWYAVTVLTIAVTLTIISPAL